MVQWLRTCSLNMEVKGGAWFKLVLFGYIGLDGYVYAYPKTTSILRIIIIHIL
jgi:hypothetical protein